MKICTRCVCDETIPGITFNSLGVCNFCDVHNNLVREYPRGMVGEWELEELAKKIKKSGKRKRYDCIIGISGGSDSSYLLHLAKVKLGLNPLAVHFDNTWNTDIAEHNMKVMTSALNIDVYRITVDEKEYTDIYRSFMLASLPDLEACTDIALTVAAHIAAEKFGIKYILEGHAYQTEGMAPLTWSYMDAKYIQSVHKKHGEVPMKTMPNLWMKTWLKWLFITRIKRVRPLYYMDYKNEKVRDFLTETYGWKWYGGNHCESAITEFFASYYRPKKANIDSRIIEYSALIRSGQMNKEDALEQLKQPYKVNEEVLSTVKKRLGFTDEEFNVLMELPLADRFSYKTYKPIFKRFKFIFWLAYKFKKLPKTFYIKYCK